MRGNVNGDEVNCDLGDLTSMIGYLFLNGDDPVCFGEANVNADPFDEIDIGDLTAVVDYLFITNTNPLMCGQFANSGAARETAADVVLFRELKGSETVIHLDNQSPLRGLQIDLIGPQGMVPRLLLGSELGLVHGARGDTLSIGVFDKDGPAVISTGTHSLISIPGEFEISLAKAADMSHRTVLPAVKAGAPNIPLTFELKQNYPNPFNPSTTIAYELPVGSEVNLSIYNVLGQTVAVLVENFQEAGSYKIQWEGRSEEGQALASGIYLYRLQAGDYTQARKMLLLK